MPAEDALFRTMRATAAALLNKQQDNGAPIDVDGLVEETLQQFRPVIDFGEHALSLRQRLKLYLEERMKR
jgi:hypothetical protein